MSVLDGAVTIIEHKVTPEVHMTQEGIEQFPMLESFFQLSQPTERQRTQMGEISEYIASRATDEMGQLEILRDIKYRLAKSDMASIHKYVKLRNLSKHYEVEAKAMENA